MAQREVLDLVKVIKSTLFNNIKANLLCDQKATVAKQVAL